MAAVGRFVLILAIVGAPWIFGAVQPWPQFILTAIVAGLTVLRLIEASLQRADSAVHIPLAGIAPLALLLIAAVQLLPRDAAPTAKMDHAFFAESAAEFAGPDHVATGTLSPSSTRREAARLYFAMAAFLLAAQWFADPQTHRSLFGAMAAGGAALGAFGIVQSLSWNGMLFWSVELRFGGTPFASYVNRNNAAGYLNMALAAAIGLGIILLGQRTFTGNQHGELASPLLKWKDRIRYGIARIDVRHVAMMGLFTVSVASILFSLSRGGILAMLAAGVAVVLTAFRKFDRKALAGIGVFIAVAAGGLLMFAGQFETIDQRLSTLSDPLSAAAGRLQHWEDTFGAVRDFPVLGTGFGTYQFANQPYQAHPSHAWYYNADNEWFEILVELGSVGLAAMALGFVLIAISSASLLRSNDPHWRAAGAVGIFLVTSQGVLAITDFGLAIPANALAFAVLGGAVCGAACREADFRSIKVPMSISLARLEGRPSQALFSFVLTAASAAFLLELLTATYADDAQDLYVEIVPDETRIAAIDKAISIATEALRFRPDDADLHQTIGNLWIDRFELQMYRRVLEDLPEQGRPTRSTIWAVSRLPALAIRLRQLEQTGQSAEVSQIRSLLAVKENLPNAQGHMEEALRHCSLARGAAMTLARLSAFYTPATSSRYLGYLNKSRFTAPSTASGLIESANLAQASGENKLADHCWRRALEVAPERGPIVWEIASQGRLPEEVMASAIPERVDVLVAIAEAIPDEEAREMLVQQADKLLKREEMPVSPLVRAKLADLQADEDGAIRYYQLALDEQPWDIETRLRLARLLRSAKKLTEAEMEYSLLLQLAPNRKEIKQEKDELRRQMLEPSVPTPVAAGDE